MAINMAMDMDITRKMDKNMLEMQTIRKELSQPGTHISMLSTRLLTQQQKWYAIYTKPHHEKKVTSQLEQDKIEAYLPLQTTIRKWSDRKKKVSEPLFSCYVFVFITMKDYYHVLNISGVVRYVTFEGKAMAIPEKQIRLIQNLLAQDLEASEPIGSLMAGAHVEIIAGPLTGFSGELVEYAGKKRVVIRIEEINKSIWLNVPVQYLALAV
jgi:transcriptional antiterminator RfaH